MQYCLCLLNVYLKHLRIWTSGVYFQIFHSHSTKTHNSSKNQRFDWNIGFSIFPSHYIYRPTNLMTDWVGHARMFHRLQPVPDARWHQGKQVNPEETEQAANLSVAQKWLFKQWKLWVNYIFSLISTSSLPMDPLLDKEG